MSDSSPQKASWSRIRNTARRASNSIHHHRRGSDEQNDHVSVKGAFKDIATSILHREGHDGHDITDFSPKENSSREAPPTPPAPPRRRQKRATSSAVVPPPPQPPPVVPPLPTSELQRSPSSSRKRIPPPADVEDSVQSVTPQRDRSASTESTSLFPASQIIPSFEVSSTQDLSVDVDVKKRKKSIKSKGSGRSERGSTKEVSDNSSNPVRPRTNVAQSDAYESVISAPSPIESSPVSDYFDVSLESDSINTVRRESTPSIIDSGSEKVMEKLKEDINKLEEERKKLANEMEVMEEAKNEVVAKHREDIAQLLQEHTDAWDAQEINDSGRVREVRSRVYAKQMEFERQLDEQLFGAKAAKDDLVRESARLEHQMKSLENRDPEDPQIEVLHRAMRSVSEERGALDLRVRVLSQLRQESSDLAKKDTEALNARVKWMKDFEKRLSLACQSNVALLNGDGGKSFTWHWPWSKHYKDTPPDLESEKERKNIEDSTDDQPSERLHGFQGFWKRAKESVDQYVQTVGTKSSETTSRATH